MGRYVLENRTQTERYVQKDNCHDLAIQVIKSLNKDWIRKFVHMPCFYFCILEKASIPDTVILV